MHVFIAGGTGLVGTRLIRRLRERQDQVTLLTRRPDVARQQFPDCAVVAGDPTEAGPWMDQASQCDAVINLTGEGIFNRRWNDEFKAVLRDSRIRSSEHVAQALARNPRTPSGTPRVLVNASAIGYYGPHGDEELTEDSPPGDDFLARLCVDWEQAARQAATHGVRVVLLRVGVVLDRQGGALAKLLPPFKFGGGGPVGSGRQVMSWIHHADLVGLFLLALDRPELSGPLNGTAPNPVTNKEFAQALGRALGRPAFLPTPGFALRLMLGEVADVILTGQRVIPARAQALNYLFRYPQLDPALADLVAG